jgi:hypothetical protein
MKFENTYKGAMMSVQVPEELKEKAIARNCGKVIRDGSAQKRQRMVIRPIIVGAIIFALTVSTALAADLPGFIRGLIIAQVETVDDARELVDETASTGADFRVGESINIEHYVGERSFSTINELRQAATFVIKEPRFIPDNVELGNLSGMLFAEENIYGATFDFLSFGDTINDVTEFSLQFSFVQLFVGADGYLEIETQNIVQQVMVGDVEAFIVRRDESDESTLSAISLYWQVADVVYIIHSYRDSLTVDTMIAIADSLQ